jgi:hypothetical protein
MNATEPNYRRSISANRKGKPRDPWREKSGWVTFYDLGVLVSRSLPAHKTYREIGAAFGITKQNAYTEAMIALGKVCYQLRQLRNADRAARENGF